MCDNSATKPWRNLDERHNPKSISVTRALHDRFQQFFMKPGQSPVFALTDLEKVVTLVSKQHSYIPPNQSLIQFLSIWSESEHEMEERSVCNRRQLDRQQILQAIHS